jgi:hypothetical protein
MVKMFWNSVKYQNTQGNVLGLHSSQESNRGHLGLRDKYLKIIF